MSDLFAFSFRETLLTREPAVGSDGATWKLVQFGERGWQTWGFLRTAPGEPHALAWVNSGIREHKTAGAAVDDLIEKLVTLGPQWVLRDEWWAARRKRIASDKARIIAAVPGDHEVFEAASHFHIWRRDPGGLSIRVYICDLANVAGMADRVIEAIAAWLAVPA